MGNVERFVKARQDAAAAGDAVLRFKDAEAKAHAELDAAIAAGTPAERLAMARIEGQGSSLPGARS